MRLKSALLAFGWGMLAAPLSRADPTSELRTLLQDFLNQPNYTWAVVSSRGKPEGNEIGHENNTLGQHEMGGYTKIHFIDGPHIPPDTPPLAIGWPGITDDQGFWSGRWVFETPEGWKLLQSFPVPVSLPAGSLAPATRSKGTPLITIPLGRIGGSFSHREIGVRRPDHEIVVILETLDRVEAVGGGAFQVELTTAGAERFVCGPPPPLPIPIPRPRITDARTTVKIWTRKGQLARYELSVEGTIGAGRLVSYTLMRELKDIGTTIIEVPDEVMRKLGK